MKKFDAIELIEDFELTVYIPLRMSHAAAENVRYRPLYQPPCSGSASRFWRS